VCRAGGGYKTRLAASLSPAIVMFVIVCCVIILGVAVEHDPHIAQQPFKIMLTFLTWVVLPGLALLCGALPFGKTLSHRSG
jgi:hypothetical protein